MSNKLSNTRVVSMAPMVTPRTIKSLIKTDAEIRAFVFNSRERIRRILSGEIKRFLVIVGPCSIHDPMSAIEYAKKLAILRSRLGGTLEIVMRVYFEKPRTALGWQGLICDPHLDGSNDMEYGLKAARELLIKINKLGVPVATEILDPSVLQYIDELVSWVAIGARTAQSPVHRNMASGFSMPAAFKNSMEGNGVSIQDAVNAIVAASYPHSFLGIDELGRQVIVNTAGNPDCQVVLRGGHGGPNYQKSCVLDAIRRLNVAREKHPGRMSQPAVFVDCSHENSSKIWDRQYDVLLDVCDQVVDGQIHPSGVMIESNLFGGNQNLDMSNPGDLEYGVSITDECAPWLETQSWLEEVHQILTSCWF